MDYKTISDRLNALEGSRVISFVGDLRDPKDMYSLYRIKRGKGRKVLISGVVHGDEPIGVYAILSFFANHVQEYEDDFEFTAFPCVNPWGFQHETRGNADKQNLNRDFRKDAASLETRLIMPLLEEYAFAMDFHETMGGWERIGDNEPEGEDPYEFYFWEICKDKQMRVGKKILENIERLKLPVCTWQKIYGDNNNNGVIWYPEDCGTACYSGAEGPFDSYLASNHSDHVFTMETPRNAWKHEDRILAHITALRTVLDEKR